MHALTHFRQVRSRYACRAAFDLGSGKIKVQVALVDTSLQKIVKIFFTGIEPVPLREDLLSQKNGKLSDNIQKEAIRVIKTLKAKAGLFNPQKYVAVGTESLRLANNGNEFAKRIEKEAMIRTKIISQEEEAILGFFSATSLNDIDPAEVVMWDSGAGSFQFACTNEEDSKYTIYKGKLGKIPMKNVITELQGKSPSKSPNPISEEIFLQAIEVIHKDLEDFPETIKEKIGRGALILKIGGHPLAGYPLDFSKQHVFKAIEKNLGKKDEEVKKNESSPKKKESLKVAPPFVVSNYILTFAIMEHLGIEKVLYPKTHGLASGLLRYQSYWE